MTEDKEEQKDRIRDGPHDSEQRAQLRADLARQRFSETDEAGNAKAARPDDKYRANTSSYQNYLFNSFGVQSKPAWSDSTGGRAIIRLFSRGIVGAAFFTVGGRMARTQLLNYNPEEFEWAMAKQKPLQAIAKTFDTVLGKPIAWIAGHTASTKGLTEAEALIARENASWNAVNFRTKGYFHSEAGKLDPHGRAMNARSLGAEMVAITFDFAMASVGDASTRNFIQMIDPNIKKTWMVNDKGQMARDGEESHFSLGQFLKSTGKAAWRVFSKNQGEDWAAALPYVYQMKAQRGILTHAFEKDLKGAKLVFDNSWNGAAFKVNNEGKIIGDYQLAGAADLHARFVGYNVYTLMFREGYDRLGTAIDNWRKDGYKVDLSLPEHINPLHSAALGARYIAKSFIKANLYMNPAVIPFWIMRTPQTKWRGALINQELGTGVNAIASKHSFDEMLQNKGLTPGEAQLLPHMGAENEVFNYNTASRRVLPGASVRDANGGIHFEQKSPYMYFGNERVQNPLYGMNGPSDARLYEHYEPGANTFFSKMLRPFGQFSEWMGTKATRAADHLPEGGFIKEYISQNEGRGMQPDAHGRETFMRNFMDASLSYTPYMFAKAELGLRVDDRSGPNGVGMMDQAIYRFIDNVCALRPREAAKAVKEMWNLGTHIERNITGREGGVVEPPPPMPPSPPTKALPSNIPALPATTIETKGSEHRRPAERSRAPEADVQNDEKERSWAESVAGRNLAAQFQAPTTHTRH